uniref:Uncharacterized protein n=1 Tax=Romanomermis culicivorax TaxID=13658 RepID=A0A915HGY9_ROMCU
MMALYSTFCVLSILYVLVTLCSSQNCPKGYVNGSSYNLPYCYIRPKTTANVVYVTDAIRACRDSDARSHLPFFPNNTNSSVLASLAYVTFLCFCT